MSLDATFLLYLPTGLFCQSHETMGTLHGLRASFWLNANGWGIRERWLSTKRRVQKRLSLDIPRDGEPPPCGQSQQSVMRPPARPARHRQVVANGRLARSMTPCKNFWELTAFSMLSDELVFPQTAVAVCGCWACNSGIAATAVCGKTWVSRITRVQDAEAVNFFHSGRVANGHRAGGSKARSFSELTLSPR